MDLFGIDSRSVTGRLLHLPLRFIMTGTVLPILSGRLRGKRWILRSGIYSCWLGTYEHAKQVIFSRIVRPGSTVFDIGANVGFYTLLASTLVGPAGRVFAFEPVARNLGYLHRHLDLNRVDNVTVIEAAVSNQSGFASFETGSGGKTGHVAPKGQSQVKTWTLDDLVSLGHIHVPDTIRMDIGGAELDALRGAKGLLSESHPIIFLSTHGRTLHQDCCGFLDSLGYNLASIDGRPLVQSREIIASL